jgi:hypothetical protein
MTVPEPHVCDESCVCPVHGTELLYWPAGCQHACRDSDCVHAHGLAEELPVAVRATAAALRTASCWLPDEFRDLLREAADGAEHGWGDACCPVCQEVECDAGCPLEDLRAGLNRPQPYDLTGVARAYEETRRSTVASLRQLHGSLAQAAGPMDAALRHAVGVVAEQLAAPSPLSSTPILAFDMVAPEPREWFPWKPLRADKDSRCYQASFGPVHYRGCACKR